MPKPDGIRGRAVLSAPEKVNQVLHILAINMATDQKKRTWMQVVELPEMGPLLWTEDLAEATKKDHETRMPKAKPRAKPNASLIIAATEFTDAEEKLRESETTSEDPGAEKNLAQPRTPGKWTAPLQAVQLTRRLSSHVRSMREKD